MMPLVVILLMASSGAVRKTSDDGTALAIERCKDRFSNREARRGCVTAYMERKKASTTDIASRGRTAPRCAAGRTAT